MARTLRDLLIQRAARLQDRPALTAPGWGTLTYTQLRNRAEGVAFGLLAEEPPPVGVFAATGTPWDWAAELAAAASGLVWDPAAPPMAPALLGGDRFHAEAGRGLYHDRESCVAPDTPFQGGLLQGEMLQRLRRLNDRLGWDHETRVVVPADRLGDPAARAALWSALYGGCHAVMAEPEPQPRLGFLARLRRRTAAPWDPAPFTGFWD